MGIVESAPSNIQVSGIAAEDSSQQAEEDVSQLGLPHKGHKKKRSTGRTGMIESAPPDIQVSGNTAVDASQQDTSSLMTTPDLALPKKSHGHKKKKSTGRGSMRGDPAAERVPKKKFGVKSKSQRVTQEEMQQLEAIRKKEEEEKKRNESIERIKEEARKLAREERKQEEEQRKQLEESQGPPPNGPEDKDPINPPIPSQIPEPEPPPQVIPEPAPLPQPPQLVTDPTMQRLDRLRNGLNGIIGETVAQLTGMSVQIHATTEVLTLRPLIDTIRLVKLELIKVSQLVPCAPIPLFIPPHDQGDKLSLATQLLTFEISNAISLLGDIKIALVVAEGTTLMEVAKSISAVRKLL